MNVVFPCIYFLLKNYEVRKSSLDLFSNLYTFYLSSCRSGTPSTRFYAILCTRGHLIHTEFHRRDYPSPCMPSDPLTLRLFAVSPSRTVWKTAVRGWPQEKSDGFGKMAVRYESLTIGEEIIRPEIRGDVVVSAARARERRVGRRVPREIYSPPLPPQWGGEIENQYSKGIECSAGLTNGPRARRMAKILLYRRIIRDLQFCTRCIAISLYIYNIFLKMLNYQFMYYIISNFSWGVRFKPTKLLARSLRS